MLPERIRNYLLADLHATPDLLDYLLEKRMIHHLLDMRTDPERFTLREALAHLADWEGVFQNRIQTICAETNPTLFRPAPDEYLIEHDYAHADPSECLTRFRSQRIITGEILQKLTESQWDRQGLLPGYGKIDITEIAVMISGHDGYHLHQIVQWLRE